LQNEKIFNAQEVDSLNMIPINLNKELLSKDAQIKKLQLEKEELEKQIREQKTTSYATFRTGNSEISSSCLINRKVYT